MRKCLIGLLCAGCLEPLVDDAPGASPHVLPPGTAVPHVSSNPALVAQIRTNDGLSDRTLEMTGGVVPLVDGWADGVAVKYWDLGDTPRVGALLYALAREDADGNLVAIAEHPMIADSLPGDPGYSAFWMIQLVPVTDVYQGEKLPSTRALDDARDLGLVGEPVPAMTYLDAPIVPPGTTLAMGDGVPPAEPMRILAHGYLVDVLVPGGGARTMSRPGSLPRSRVYRVWEDNALDPQRKPIFADGADRWTPLVEVVDVRLTTVVGLEGEVDDEADLFVADEEGKLVATTERVDEWTATASYKNWPIFAPAGVTP